MKIFLHATVIAPAIPTELFDYNSEKIKIDNFLANVKFNIEDDATYLGNEIGYGLVSDKVHKEYTTQKNRLLNDNGKKIGKSAHAHNNPLAPDVIEWINKNISKSNITEGRYSFSTPGRHRLGPHRDVTREYVLLYLLDGGGDDHATVFYRELGNANIVFPPGYHIDDYSKLEEISRVKLKLNSWNLISAEVLHSVENLTGVRKSFMIGFKEIPNGLTLKNSTYYDTETQQIIVE